MIFINFKTYQQGTGEFSLNLAKICSEITSQTKIKIIPIVQTADIYRLAHQGLDVWAQAVDAIEFGAHTGGILPEAVLAAGAKGVLINHSEKKLSLTEIEKILGKLNNCKTLVCTDSLIEGQTIVNFKPTFLAYEPPELIGGKISVSQARPEIIKEFVNKMKETPILVGAGVHTSQDIKKALELGAKGVLVSSEVVLATDPRQTLLKLIEGFK